MAYTIVAADKSGVSKSVNKLKAKGSLEGENGQAWDTGAAEFLFQLLRRKPNDPA